MELIYLYIEKFNEGIIKNQQINFSPNFYVEIIDKKLVIKNKKSNMNRLYSKNIKNITALIGKNGAGKTTILDILGMNRDDRINKSIKRNEVVDSYFMIYHIEEEYFGIEIMDDIEKNSHITNLFRNKLTNFNFNEIKGPFYKIPMGLLVKKYNDDFQVIEHFFSKFISSIDRVSDQIGINYISNSYSNRIDKRYNHLFKDNNGYEKEPYLFKRRYYLTPSKEREYKFINHLKNHKDLGFGADWVTIEITSDFDYGLEPGTENEEIKQWINELEKKLGINKKRRINIFNLSSEDNKKNEEIKSKDDKIGHKKLFILNTLSSYIIYQFVEGICAMIDDKSIRKNNYLEEESDIYKEKQQFKHIKFCEDKISKFLDDLKKKENIQCNSQYVLGDLEDKEIEYNNLVRVIDYYNRDEDLNDYDKLIYISRYLYSRMEDSISLGSDSRYQIAIEEFFDSLNLLDESYFNYKNICIKCNLDVDENVVKIFKIYDKYVNNQYNDLHMRFKINFSNLSEGENKFLDLLSKVFDIVTGTRDNKLAIILLDEPDQSLHPDWSRQFIKVLCNEIKKYENKNIQIILSTHSPFLASDLPRENIVFIEKCKVCDGDNFMQTFGANIHTLLTNSFFMKNTIGEFANEQIKNCLRIMDKYKRYSKNEIKKEKFKEDYIEFMNCEKDNSLDIEKLKVKIKYINEIIGEPLIKRKVEENYRMTFPESIEEYQMKIEELEKEKVKLEDRLKDKDLDSIGYVMELLNNKIKELKMKVEEI
ncbi:MAG: AAA family ATPase [Clostridium sp.]|uniref:AAA family ATPase n=1 Tax=Clostridium sp. TaxID=1506 RepID=UPI00291247E6|nr:AAA family ATPase [Clostridium sp.]MDU7253557.1 AAA family ATPase [Clostridium sp.]